MLMLKFYPSNEKEPRRQSQLATTNNCCFATCDCDRSGGGTCPKNLKFWTVGIFDAI